MGCVTKGKRKVTIELEPAVVEYVDWLVRQGEYRSRGEAIGDLVRTARQGGYVVGDPKSELAMITGFLFHVQEA